MANRRSGSGHRTGEPARGHARSFPGRIRIIGGQWRGRLLPVVEQPGLRPTPNRIRETLFNWLQPWIEGARCLDVTAGTGSLCFEALSRGAAEVVLVEQSRDAVIMLHQNLERLGAAHATVIQGDALGFLSGPVQGFDIIFLDPPFASELVEQCYSRIVERDWLKPGGWLYIEAPATRELPALAPDWTLYRSKKTGQVGYHLIRYKG